MAPSVTPVGRNPERGPRLKAVAQVEGLMDLTGMVSSPKQMLKDLFECQAAILAHVDKYAPIREVFEEFLQAGTREDAGFLWWMSPGARQSRYNWKRQAVLNTADGQRVVVRAFTNPKRYGYSEETGDVHRALIDVRVSLPENPTVATELELPPVWAILGQRSTVSFPELDKLGNDLAEIVPLVRALLPQS